MGRVPDYILSDEKKTLGTTATYKRAKSFISEGRSNALGAVREYISRFSSNLVTFQLPSFKRGDNFYNQVIDSINEFLPYREEWLDILYSVCNNGLLVDVMNDYIRFFEDIHKYTFPRSAISHPYRQEEDNMKFIEYELMLCFVAILLKKECFNEVSDILNGTFYNKYSTSDFDSTYTYREFEHFLYSIFYHNEQGSTRYHSLQAKIIKDRMESCTHLDMTDICQADFVCWLFHIGHNINDNMNLPRWFPHNILYACNMRRPFEIFARAESLRYLESIKVIFDYNSKEDFLNLYNYIIENRDSLVPRWEFESPNIKLLMNIDRLGTRK